MAALDIAREIAQLRATPGANWLAQALQKIADHVNAPVPVPPEPPAPKPVTLASLLPPGTTLLTAGSAAPGHPTGATGTLLSVPVSSGTVMTDLSNPDNQGSAPVSVGLTMPSDFTVTGSPAQNNQTIAVTRTTETANTVLAGPSSGAAAVPTYRALVAADIPAPAGDVTGTYAATEVTGLHFGTNSCPLTTAAPTSGDALIWNGADIVTEVLPISGGGTGTATPGLVAGANVSISGSWPDETVALDADIAVNTVTAATDGAGVARAFTVTKTKGNTGGSFWFFDGTEATSYGGLGFAGVAGNYVYDAAEGDVVLRSDIGVLRLSGNAGDSTAFGVNTSNYPFAVQPIDCQASTAITSAPPTFSENAGWKIGLWGADYWLGIASSTLAVMVQGNWSVFSSAVPPASNGSATAPDSNAVFTVQDSGNVVLKPISAAPSGTWPVGSIQVDCTNNKIWVYCTGGWKGVTIS